ncbi:hypothetical protein [Micromonospora sp. WMMC415]|uniref:hypothetical protein n=1 Tax=Micromonospora sp. WMMC415 TaxID=2675222 RepID=UPI001E60AF75|nr:hypothetical protein [Micromonospora sp. WMMC415]
MGGRALRVVMVLLGAVLLGTAGLSAGAWYGGRGATPPTPERSTAVAEELLPGTHASGSMIVRGWRYGVVLADDDYGSGRTELHYGESPDCALTGLLRRTAESRGWRDGRAVPGSPCDGWRVERDGLLVTLVQHPTGTRLAVTAAPPAGFEVAVVGGTVLGALAGAGLFLLLARTRRQPLAAALVTVGLLPGAQSTWSDLLTDGLAAPTWPAWRALAPVLVPWLVIALVTAAVLARPATRPATPAPAEAT